MRTTLTRSLSENELSRIRIGLQCYADQLKNSGDTEVEKEWLAILSLAKLFKMTSHVTIIVPPGRRGQLA